MNAMQVPQSYSISQARLSELRQAAGTGPALIHTHDNPDPDGLASGKAMAALLQGGWGIPCRLVYSGLVARAENIAMLRLLTPEWEHVDTLENPDQYSSLILVDTQPTAGNNSLPDDITPHIVIDHHHPVRERLSLVPFVNVRTDVGATASLVYCYLQAAGIEPDPTLATAIFYGIQTDTRGLSRGDSALDQAVYFNLLSLIDRRCLAQVEQAGLPREYFRAFSNGLGSARLYGQVVISYLGAMHRPDFMAEMADLLIRLDGARAVLCLGHHSGVMYLSLRTASMEQDAGSLIQRVVMAPGRAGGHGATAGGQVPLLGKPSEQVAEQIRRRFLDAMGQDGEGEPLLL
ncbi:MAG: DHH family phosphoesterase [Anaerolineales bacterium]|nr:DHH family phosphoesterase [Anaerolineales bacterium]